MLGVTRGFLDGSMMLSRGVSLSNATVARFQSRGRSRYPRRSITNLLVISHSYWPTIPSYLPALSRASCPPPRSVPFLRRPPQDSVPRPHQYDQCRGAQHGYAVRLGGPESQSTSTNIETRGYDIQPTKSGTIRTHHKQYSRRLSPGRSPDNTNPKRGGEKETVETSMPIPATLNHDSPAMVQVLLGAPD